jgi:addiction module RelE/StbE family toxin
LKIIWTQEALQDRTDIWDHIAVNSFKAATQIDELFSDTAKRLAEFPKLGKLGKIPGTHELFPHENYRLVYEIEGKTVWILAVVHTARQWPLP